MGVDAPGGAHRADEMRDRPKPRVLVVTQYYRPEPNFITADVASALARDAQVVVIAAHPNYPAGRFHPGTRWWRPVRSDEDGVVVWRVPVFPYHGPSLAGRALCYLSFLFFASLLAPFVAGRPALVWVYNTPFTTALLGVAYRAVCGSRLALTCADLWPESFTATGVMEAGVVTRLLYAYRRACHRRADALLCATRGALDVFHGEGVARAALSYVPVWVEGTERGVPRLDDPADDEAVLVYAGNLGPAQQLETVVEAAALLRARGARVRFDLYGDGQSAQALREQALAAGADNVRFPGRVPPAEAFALSTGATGQIVSLRSTPFFRMTVPSKLAFCLAAAAPVLYGLEGEAAEIAAGSGGALPFVPGDAASLADAVERLLAMEPAERSRMRRALRATYEREFARSSLVERYRQLLLAQARTRTRGAAAAATEPVRPRSQQPTRS